MKKTFLLTWMLGTVTSLLAQTTYSIFQPTDAPFTALANDGQALQVGIKFRASQNGNINGIRFYKGSGTTGTHIGQLYSSGGSLLASATFTGETSSGWQEVLFSTPVAILSNVTYVASMHSSSGDYCYTNPFFSSDLENGPLRALANGEDGGNGIYSYSATPVFPTTTTGSGNYYVDVVFVPAGFSGTTGYLPKFTASNIMGNSQVYDNGTNVGIGTASPGPYKLAVEGILAARKIKVTQVTPWADYVFEKDYHLPTLTEVEQYIRQHKHLPEVPSAAEVEKEGIDLGNNQAILLKKIEELTLYLIEQNKKLEMQERRIKYLEAKYQKSQNSKVKSQN